MWLNSSDWITGSHYYLPSWTYTIEQFLKIFNQFYIYTNQESKQFITNYSFSLSISKYKQWFKKKKSLFIAAK